jgi:uncharacterized protein (TIGR02186 family)
MKGISIAVIAVFLGAFLMAPFFSGDAAEALTIKANHDHIDIDFFYNGSTVSVKGNSGKGADVVVVIASAEQHPQSLRRKGHVGGVLWMNVGGVTFDNVPGLYIVRSTRDIDSILEPGVRDSYAIGYPAVMKKAGVSGVDDREKDRWAAEFIKFKEASHLYSASAGTVTTEEAGGDQSYSVHVDWPYQAQPGDYVVTVYEVKDGKIVDTATANVVVEQTGLVKTLADMARNNGALYGIVAILIALGAGFGVGMIFRKGGGAH